LDALAAIVPQLTAVASATGVAIEELSSDVDLTRWITQEAVDRLLSYSGSANRSIPHPLDTERWREFVCQVYRDGRKLSPDVLRRYMDEELHWDEEQAYKHACDFESGLALLQHFDQGTQRYPRPRPSRN
jgi:hypothetical protein